VDPVEPPPLVRQLRVLGRLGSFSRVPVEVCSMGVMNKPIKQVLRIGGVVIGLGAAVWALRDRLLPAPQIPDGPPPRFRSADTSVMSGDDLTAVKGIGPVYAERLVEADITTFAELVDAGVSAVSEAAGVSESTAVSWMEQADSLS